MLTVMGTSLWHNLSTWVQILLALGGIILVHEIGHFMFAKWTGIHVDEFAVGLGPTVAKWERNGTLYRVAPLLFMGYVRIRGLEGEENAEVLPGGFYSRPHYQRILVMIGGALVNLVTAALLFGLVYTAWGVLDENVDTTLATVQPGSAAEAAGLVADCRIIALDGQTLAKPEAIEKAVKASGGREMTFRVVYPDGTQRDQTITPRRDDGTGRYLIGVVFRTDFGFERKIGRVTPGGPAAAAGLRRGDEILTLGGRRVTHPTQIVEALTTVPTALEKADARSTKLPPVGLTVERGGEVIEMQVTPKAKKSERIKPTAPGEKAAPAAERPLESYLVADPGFQLQRRMKRLGLATALWTGITRTEQIVVDVTQNVIQLFRGVGLKQVGGPVMIVKSLSDAASVGLYDLLTWAASLSIMIGVFNLLPLPALDGGRVVFILIDWVASALPSRRQVDRRLEGTIHAVGLMLLLALMVVITFRDLTR
ncbi:MAG: RIP metalloprotease RseP [Armatimonadetes bacterium]|nr:RIP metalloprotease RseP [Armatimonadota bacterium]